MKIDAVKMGISCGIVWTFGVLLIAIAAHFGLWIELYNLFTKLYLGFDNTSLQGMAVGLAWSFTDAFIGVFLAAFIYNKIVG